MYMGNWTVKGSVTENVLCLGLSWQIYSKRCRGFIDFLWVRRS